MVVVAALTAHVNHRVYRRTSTEHLTSRIAYTAAVQTSRGFRRETPVSARIANSKEIANRHVYPEVVVLAARLYQQYARFWILGKAIGKHATGRTRAHDNVIVFLQSDASDKLTK